MVMPSQARAFVDVVSFIEDNFSDEVECINAPIKSVNVMQLIGTSIQRNTGPPDKPYSDTNTAEIILHLGEVHDIHLRL